MPRGHAARREGKKPKKKANKGLAPIPPTYASSEVEIVKKRRKPNKDEEEQK